MTGYDYWVRRIWSVFFFYNVEYAWDEKGAKNVESTVWDDKRQYTGNLIHNAFGELLTIQLIFGGKSSLSLPTAHKDTHQKNWIVGFSENHWSNLTEKKKFVEWVVNWRNKRVDDLIRSRLIPASRKETLPLVLLLDCWSVNTSREFRAWVAETYPFIRLRYISAGLTGKCQINDTKSWCVLKQRNGTKKSLGSLWSDSMKEISLQLAWKGKLKS